MIRCVGLIPAEETVNSQAGLNVLVMAINRGEESAEQIVSLFGTLDSVPRLLTDRVCTLAPGEHAHLYFHIPPVCFTESFWGTSCDELTLFAGTDAPQTTGKLVFVE